MQKILGLRTAKIKLALFIIILVLVFIALFSGLRWGNYFGISPDGRADPASSSGLSESDVLLAGAASPGRGSGRGSLPASSSRRSVIVRAVEKAYPAVVFIGVTQIRIVSPYIDDPFFRQFFPPTYRKYQSMGSGVILDKSGLIISNYHVVEGASELQVTLCDGRKFKAELLGTDKGVDLAVLKIKGKNLPSIEMGSSRNLMLGEWAIAIGNPFGELIHDAMPSVTLGVISALHRDFNLNTFHHGDISYRSMIQTDAAINPGNSGGALVDSDGRLIGINTFIFTKNRGGSVGVGFSIPVERAQRILKEIRKHGRIRPFWTGISVQDVNPVLARTLGLEESRGVIVTEVSRKSPAERAGIKVGDVITRVNRYPVYNRESILGVFSDFYADDTISVSAIRKNKRIKLRMILEEKRTE
jgi:serine protease Do